MSPPSAETAAPGGAVPAVREYLAALPDDGALGDCIAEGRAVAAIL